MLGLRQNQVRVTTKRLGGGFGGKEGIFQYSCLSALAAMKMRRSVNCFLEFADDMLYTGKRHESYIEGVLYANKKTKKFEFYDVHAYTDAGYATDLSPAVLERLVYHIDNSYYFKAIRVVGRACKTNLRSNTAFRGFGAPQAVLFTELMVEKAAKTLGICALDLRKINLYTAEDLTQYSQKIGDIPLLECFDSALEKSKYHTL